MEERAPVACRSLAASEIRTRWSVPKSANSAFHSPVFSTRISTILLSDLLPPWAREKQAVAFVLGAGVRKYEKSVRCGFPLCAARRWGSGSGLSASHLPVPRSHGQGSGAKGPCCSPAQPPSAGPPRAPSPLQRTGLSPESDRPSERRF